MSWKDDLNYGLAAFGVQIPDRVQLDEWSAKLAGRPARNTFVTVAAGAMLFYHFERGRNPRVREFADALLYCSTCLTVGYAEVQPVTTAGKLLGSLLQTYGPSLANRMVDGPTGSGTQHEILATAREILAKLEAAAPANDPRPA
jgi:hypothetical protein